MSGGHFAYAQYHIQEISESIERAIEKQKLSGEFTEATEESFREAVRALNIAYIYAHRIDWLLSCDDREVTYLEQLREDLAKVNRGF
jgi:hypothetical protein